MLFLREQKNWLSNNTTLPPEFMVYLIQTNLTSIEIRDNMKLVADSNYLNKPFDLLQFNTSYRRTNFHWQKDSFVFWKKSLWNGIFYHVLKGKLIEENGKTKIELTTELNIIAKIITATIFAFFFGGLVWDNILQKNNSLSAILQSFCISLITFSPIALAIWFISRSARKNAIDFIKNRLEENPLFYT